MDCSPLLTPIMQCFFLSLSLSIRWLLGGPWGTMKTLLCRLPMPQISTLQKRFGYLFLTPGSCVQGKNVPQVLTNLCFYLGKYPQNRNDIKNGSILRLTTSPVSLISLQNVLISAYEHSGDCGCTERKFCFYYLKASFINYFSSSSLLSTLVPNCSPASWADPVIQHGCQAGVSEGPG